MSLANFFEEVGGHLEARGGSFPQAPKAEPVAESVVSAMPSNSVINNPEEVQREARIFVGAPLQRELGY